MRRRRKEEEQEQERQVVVEEEEEEGKMTWLGRRRRGLVAGLAMEQHWKQQQWQWQRRQQ